jgi:uncharacterized repeat protein (TIGR04042 family)
MPEMSFRIRWPDASEANYYSPSLVIHDFLTPGEILTLPDFLRRAGEALQIASDRVAKKYGFPCARAHASLAAINEAAAAFVQNPNAEVMVMELSKWM